MDPPKEAIMENLIIFIFDIVGYLIIPLFAKLLAHDNTSNGPTIDRSGFSEQIKKQYDGT
jgi:hypothetical protein